MGRAGRELLIVVVVVAALLVAATGAYFELPDLVVGPEDFDDAVPAPSGAEPAPAPSAVDLVQARNGARTAAVALVAAAGAAIGAAYAGRTFYLARRGQVAERLDRADEALGSTDVARRSAAVQRLERLMAESPRDRRAIIATLAAFLRRPRSSPATVTEAPQDVQEAAAAILRLRRPLLDRRLTIDLRGADLRSVILEAPDLRRAKLRGARLEGAQLKSANLRGADLMDVRARSVRLDDARLAKAKLNGADLQMATLDGVKAARATFTATTLQGTWLRGADLRRSRGVPMDQGTVAGAKLDAKTRLPGG